MAVFCGIDWAEGHHDIALVDGDGQAGRQAADRREPRRVRRVDGDVGRGRRQRGGADPGGDRDTARAAGRGVAGAPAGRSTRSTRWRWPGIGNAARCRARRATTSTRWRWRTSCAPTPTCIGCCRTTRALARSITVLARAYQDAVWRRTKLVQELRARLREYYPGFPGRVRAATGSGRAVHHPAGQRRRPRGAGHRTQPRGRPEGVEGPGRDRAASRRTATPHRHRAAAHRRRAAGPAAAPGPAGGAGDARPRRSGCSACSMRSATRSTGSPPPWPRRSGSIRTTRSSPASPAWPTSAARSCSPRSATTAPGSSTTGRCRPSPAPPRSPGPPASPGP